MKRVEVRQVRRIPNCPKCKTELNGHSNVTGDSLPEPGDVGLCAHCLQPLVFAHTIHGDLTVRRPITKEERARIKEALAELFGGNRT